MHQAFSQVIQSAATLGHLFKHVGGKSRCLHCGQTAENFQFFKNDCGIPQIRRYNEPNEEDQFAIFCADTGAASFVRTVAEGEAFRIAQDDRFCWSAPLPLLSVQPVQSDGPGFPSFQEFVESRGPLRPSDNFSVQEALTETINNLKLPEVNSLTKYYLCDGDLWELLEAAAWREIGHFVGHLRSTEPHEALCRAVDDIVNVMRERGFGPIDVANVLESAQFHFHVRRFAREQIGTCVNDDEAVDRAAYWVRFNCHFYATWLRDHFNRTHEFQKSRSTVLRAEVESEQPTPELVCSNHGASRWDEIEIEFLSDHQVQIRTPNKSEVRNYRALGLNDGRSGLPRKAWEVLCLMAQNNGFLADGRGTGQSWVKIERRVQEIRSVFRKVFGLSQDPVPFVSKTGYKTRFKITCAPSFFG